MSSFRNAARMYGRWLVALGSPLSLVPLELTHPHPGAPMLHGVVPVAGWWITLHVLLLIAFGLFAAGVVAITWGRDGPLVPLTWASVAVFVAANSAFIAIDGIAVGLIARQAASLPADQLGTLTVLVRGLTQSDVVSWIARVAVTAWTVGIVAAAVVVWPPGRSRLAWTLVAVTVALRLIDGFVPTGAVDLFLRLSVLAALATAAAVFVATRHFGGATSLFLLLLAALLPQHGTVLGAAGVCSFLVGAVLVLLWESGMLGTVSGHAPAPAAVETRG